jgi:hypothetical protein
MTSLHNAHLSSKLAYITTQIDVQFNQRKSEFESKFESNLSWLRDVELHHKEAWDM